MRDRGRYGTVSILWRVTLNSSIISDGQDFLPTSGSVAFLEGERQQFFDITVLSDGLPEFDEVFAIELQDLSG